MQFHLGSSTAIQFDQTRAPPQTQKHCCRHKAAAGTVTSADATAAADTTTADTTTAAVTSTSPDTTTATDSNTAADTTSVTDTTVADTSTFADTTNAAGDGLRLVGLGCTGLGEDGADPSRILVLKWIRGHFLEPHSSKVCLSVDILT